MYFSSPSVGVSLKHTLYWLQSLAPAAPPALEYISMLLPSFHRSLVWLWASLIPLITVNSRLFQFLRRYNCFLVRIINSSVVEEENWCSNVGVNSIFLYSFGAYLIVSSFGMTGEYSITVPHEKIYPMNNVNFIIFLDLVSYLFFVSYHFLSEHDCNWIFVMIKIFN